MAHSIPAGMNYSHSIPAGMEWTIPAGMEWTIPFQKECHSMHAHKKYADSLAPVTRPILHGCHFLNVLSWLGMKMCLINGREWELIAQQI